MAGLILCLNKPNFIVVIKSYKMNLIKIFFLSLICIGTLTLSSCDDDDPVIPNEEELITTLRYILTPASGSPIVILSFQDVDGDGGNAPIIMGGILTANTVYSGSLELLNEAASPTANISDEIEEEKEDHQFFFSSTLAEVTVEYDDLDNNGNPVGLSTKLTTGAAGNGILNIVLRHQPDKSASGVGAGDISNAGGETDIEVEFEIIVQ